MTIPKADNLMQIYIKRIESLKTDPEIHSKEAQKAEQSMMFKTSKLNGARKSPRINSSQFIQAVIDNMRTKLFTTASNKADQSTREERASNYKDLINNLSVLNCEKWQENPENPHFGEKKIRALADQLRINQQETHLEFVEFKASGGKNIPGKLKKLILAVDTLAASNTDCERGFSAMNNIITVKRTVLTTRHVVDLLFISCVGPPYTQWIPMPDVKLWLGKGRRAAHSSQGMARQQGDQ
ncbi:unnamed protein product [Caretta caretta]